MKIKSKTLVMLFILMFLLFATLSFASASENITFDEKINAENENINIEDYNSDNLNYLIEDVNNNSNLENKHEDNVLSQSNDENSLGYTATQITVPDYLVTLSPTVREATISTLTAKVQTRDGRSVDSGSVYFEINKNYYDKVKTFSIGVSYGTASHDFGIKTYLEPGKYKCTAYYSDYKNIYESCSCNFYVTVRSRTALSIENINCNINEEFIISPKIERSGGDPTEYGTITYTIDSQTYTSPSSLRLTMSNGGLYKCSAKFDGNPYYLSSSATFYINVRDTARIIYDVDSYSVLAGEKFDVNYRIVDSYGSDVKTGQSKLTHPPKSGYTESKTSARGLIKKTVTAPNMPGEYKYTINYYGSSSDMPSYSSCESDLYMNVYSLSSINAQPVKSKIGEKTNIQVNVVDHLGQNIPEGTVKVMIAGITYTAKVNNGKAIFNNVKMPSKAGTYKYEVTYSTDSGLYKSSIYDLQVTCLNAPKITVKSVTGYVGKTVKLTAIVKDNVGNNIKKGVVEFKVNGKTYKTSVNNGKAIVKIKTPKSEILKVRAKTKNNIVTKTSNYKKTYSATATVRVDGGSESSSTTFKLISKYKKIQKYRIIKKEVKTITIPYKHWGYREKTSGHYVFGILHEQQEGNRISIIAGDKTTKQLIKFSSKAYYINHGQKVYSDNGKWLKSKHHDDVHYYNYIGEYKIYLIIKYNAYTYKKI